MTTATLGLSRESAERVRNEIQQHYESAQEAGDDALAALGKRNEARAAWGRYLILAPDAPDRAEVERRMGEGRTTIDLPAGR